MQIQIRNRCSDFNSYRAARVKSLFNAESGCNFDLDADMDLAGGRADHPCHCVRGRFQRRDWRARLRRACSVPTWLRPYPVLSNGEKFRADLARLVCDAPERAIVDEFTSVVDRQSSARSPSPRHGGG